MRLFVLIPASDVTDSSEALHQLADKATALGYDASVVYVHGDHPNPPAEPFRCSRTAVAPALVDARDSFVVAPESEVPRLLTIGLAQRAVWWLRVSDFTTRAEALQSQLRSAQPPLDVVFDSARHFLHLTQSEYAQQYVRTRGARGTMLTDCLRTEIIEEARHVRSAPKDDVVLFGPSSDPAFAQRLMESAPAALEWVPLGGLAPAEVTQLMDRAKVYVDFGDHTGRSRIPREAALRGCCVITGSRGSAGNGVDVPLPSGYRFDDADPATPVSVIELITEVLADHTTHSARFAGYRDWIEGHERRFTHEVFAVMSGVESHQQRKLRLTA